MRHSSSASASQPNNSWGTSTAMNTSPILSGGMLQPIPEDDAASQSTLSAAGTGAAQRKPLQHDALVQLQKQQRQMQGYVSARALPPLPPEGPPSVVSSAAAQTGGSASLVSGANADVAGDSSIVCDLPSVSRQPRKLPLHSKTFLPPVTPGNAKMFLLSSILLIGVIAGIVAIAVTTATKDGKNAGVPLSTDSNKTTPTSSPTMDSSVFETLDPLLRSVSDPSAFDDPRSPQSKARDWILTEDWLRNDLLYTSSQHYRVLQRYLLALFYYSTNGPESWNLANITEEKTASTCSAGTTSTNVFLCGAVSECEWPGVTCNNTDSTTTSTDNIMSSSTTSDNGVVSTEEEPDRNHFVIKLNFTSINMTGTLPVELAALSALTVLALPSNRLTGAIPGKWFTAEPCTAASKLLNSNHSEPTFCWEQLTYFDVSQNNLNQSIPEALWSVPLLQYLYLNQNSFTGRAFPENLDVAGGNALQYLKHMWADQNKLTGPILPTWFVDLPVIQTWFVYDNQLTGRLNDTDFDAMHVADGLNSSTLTHMDLSFNSMSGTIPNSLLSSQGPLQSLRRLYLDQNSLTGTLPAGNTNMSQLEDVWLQSNQLHGTIPRYFAKQWHSLRELRLHDNNLTMPAVVNRNTTAGWLNDDCHAANGTKIRISYWPRLTMLEADCHNQTIFESNGTTSVHFPEMQCTCCTVCR